MKVMIVGAPKCGKTTLAEHVARRDSIPLLKCDDLMHLPWSEVSDKVASDWMKRDEFLIEGVSVARSIRKFFAMFPDEKPCDRVVLLREPLVEQSKGQRSMGKSVETVFAEIEQELERLGVEVVTCDTREEAMALYGEQP